MQAFRWNAQPVCVLDVQGSEQDRLWVFQDFLHLWPQRSITILAEESLGGGKRTDYITSLTQFSRFSISWECVSLDLFCNLPHSDLSLSLKFSRTWQDFSKNIYLCTWLSRVLVGAFEMNFFAAHGLSCPLDCGMLVSPPGIPPTHVSCIGRHRLVSPGPAGKF